MTQRVDIPDVQLRSWRATGYPYKLIAAAIAEWAADQERGTVLPDDAEFGRGLDRVVGPKPFPRSTSWSATASWRSTTARSTSR